MQGSLFAPDALAPPARPPGATPDPFAPSSAAASPPPEARAPSRMDSVTLPRDAVATPSGTVAPPVDALAPSPDEVAAPADAVAAPPDEVARPSEAFAPARGAPWTDYAGGAEDAFTAVDYADAADLEPAHARVAPAGSMLAGPTLDDLMSRVWEGLRAEVPTPCPICRTEIEPSAHGRCGACGSTLA
jgi:hypothetical protein